MENNFKVILEAIIDNSSLTNVQKKVAKERLKINADISVEDFAKSKQELEKQITNLAVSIKTILGDAVSDKQASQWAKQYYDSMVSGAKQAVKEQKKLNETQKKSSLAEQSKYYQRIIDNNKTIYSLKNKLLTADKEQTTEINKQIKALEQRNRYNSNQLSKKGLTNNSWERAVNSSKKALENQLKINTAKQTDVENTNNATQADKERVSLVEKLAKSYQSIKNLEIRQNNLDTSKDANKIAELDKQIKQATNDYNLLLNSTNKNANFDSSAWDKTKSAIDAVTQSQIEYNNAKKQDSLNSAVTNEITSLDKLKSKWDEQGILVGEFKTKVEQLEASLSSIGNKGELNGLKSQIQTLETEASRLAEINNFKINIAPQINDNISSGFYTDQVQQQIEKYQKLGIELPNVQAKIVALQTAEENLRSVMTSGAATVEEQQVAWEAYESALKSANQSTSLANSLYMSQNEVDGLIAKFKTVRANNSAMTSEAKVQLDSWIAKLSETGVKYKSLGNEANTALTKIVAEQRTLGRLGDNWITTISKGMETFTQWFSGVMIVMKVITTTKKAVSAVETLDTALVDLKKTTSMTASQLEEFYYTSNDVAKQVGVTTEEIISQAAAWSRLNKIGLLYGNI